MKRCFVPRCRVDSDTYPPKKLLFVPEKEERRRQWFKAVGSEYSFSHRYCCEDHFDLESDAKNYMYYKLYGSRLYIKEHVVPHKFLEGKQETGASQKTSKKKNRKKVATEKLQVSNLAGQLADAQPSTSKHLSNHGKEIQQDPLAEEVHSELSRETLQNGPLASLRGQSEHQKYGYTNSRLEERSGYSNSLLHAADEPTNQLCFGVQGPDSAVESFTENEDDNSKVDKLCRLCLVELTTFTYIYEFDDIHMFNVSDAINDLLGMDLNPDDGYPTKICNACIEELSHFRHFKRKCFSSKAKLKDMVGGNDYCAVQIKSEGGDSLLGYEDNVINEIPVPSKEEEIIPEDEEYSMAAAHVKCEILSGDDEELMEGIDSSGKEMDSFLNSHQSRSVAGKSQENVPDSSQRMGDVTVKKEFRIFCHPANTSDGRNDAVKSDDTGSGSGRSSKHKQGSNSGKIINSVPEPPTVKTENSVPVKTEMSSDDGLCNNQVIGVRKSKTRAS